MNAKFKFVIKIYLLLTLLAQFGFIAYIIWRLGFDRFLFFASTETIHILKPAIFSFGLFIALVLLGFFILMMPGGLLLMHYFQESDKSERDHKAVIDNLKKKSEFKM